MRTEADTVKMKAIKTRYHRILFDQDSPYKRHNVVPNKKKYIPRKSKNKNINSIED
jgi:hypothetical protein